MSRVYTNGLCEDDTVFDQLSELRLREERWEKRYISDFAYSAFPRAAW